MRRGAPSDAIPRRATDHHLAILGLNTLTFSGRQEQCRAKSASHRQGTIVRGEKTVSSVCYPLPYRWNISAHRDSSPVHRLKQTVRRAIMARNRDTDIRPTK